MSLRPENNNIETPGGKADISGSAMLEDALDAHGGALAEGNGHCTAGPDNPLCRQVVVSISASLAELCNQQRKAIWQPTRENIRAMLQQRKFTSLSGEGEAQGDLQSVVLHDLTATQVSSTFPIALGAKITGVDNITYASTGEPYSMVILPKCTNTQPKVLQKDDVSVAYSFAKKFPGYTAQNISTKGVHEVTQRRFVLVAADHPIVTAISENADKLQMGEISMMPEGLVKISSPLYESILPYVTSQVQSQIRVRDFSQASVSIHPANFSSWEEARATLSKETSRRIKAQHAAEVAANAGDTARLSQIEATFKAKERQAEHDLLHKPMDVHMCLDLQYNVSVQHCSAPFSLALTIFTTPSPPLSFLARSSSPSEHSSACASSDSLALAEFASEPLSVHSTHNARSSEDVTV